MVKISSSRIDIPFSDPGVIVDFRRVTQKEGHGLHTLSQVHGANGRRVSGAASSQRGAGTEGDWLWTTDLTTTLGVFVADCTAALGWGLAADGKFLIAIHAGWRGTAARIFQNVHSVIQPSMWELWLSPSICESHFEVGEEVLDALGSDSRRFARPSGKVEKFFFDLKGFQSEQLHALGARVHLSSHCTYCEPSMLSYRRSKGQLTERHLATVSYSVSASE